MAPWSASSTTARPRRCSPRSPPPPRSTSASTSRHSRRSSSATTRRGRRWPVRDGAAIVFAHELRVNLRGLLAWLLPVGGLLALTCALQRSYVDSGLFEAKLQSLPAA